MDKWILVATFLLYFFFQNWLGSISLITHYRFTGWSVPTVCALYPDSQTVETLRSACIFMCRLVMLSFKKAFWDKQCNFWPGFNVRVQPRQCFLQSPIFCETANIWKFTSFCVNILITVLFRVLNIKLNSVKLTFWTATSSHQVMGMSLTKVWVNVAIRWKSASVSQNRMNREHLSIKLAIPLKPRVICDHMVNFNQ